MSELKNKLEFLRNKLNEMLVGKGLVDAEVLQLSREIDELIVEMLRNNKAA